MNIKGIVTAIFLICIMSSSTDAYDNKVTHKEITKAATASPKFDNYLKNNLGILNGYKESIGGKPIIEWLRQGSYLEDIPDCRATNHFHDPTKPWDQSYMSDDTTLEALTIRYFCNETGWPYANRKSAVTWATGYLAPSPNGTKAYFTDDPMFAPINWDAARKLYFDALTNRVRNTREKSLSDTFSAVGQVLHLLQDMTVPAHVRNDFQSHLFKNQSSFLGGLFDRYQPYELYVQINPRLVTTAVPVTPSFNVPIRLTDYWDTKDLYNNKQPSISTSIGASEFTNANYFSDFTIRSNSPTPEHTFDYPSISGSGYQICTDYAHDSLIKRKYISREPCPQLSAARSADHFAVASLINPESAIAAATATGNLSSLKVWLDNNVHNTYAKNLLPRAVGYSAGLLNYFFRGNIRLGYETSGTPGFVFINKTGERVEGDFTIYYDTAKDERYPVWIGQGYLESTMGDKTNTIDFIPPANPKEPGKYIVVFNGKMGNEEGAVAGYVFSRVLEITPPSQYIYSMVDGSATDPYFTRIRAKMKNPSTSEQMQKGTVQAVAKYKADTYDTDFIYSVSEPKAIDLSNNAQVEVEFNFDNDPVPVDATDLYLQVIFKGKIGTDDGAVAIGIKDISEPTPIDVFNDTDRSCIKGTWYSASDAIDLMDTNDPKDHIADTWDVNPHILQDIYVKISSIANPQDASPSVYNAVVPLLYPGEFKRVMYVLTDYNFTYSFYETWSPAPGYTDHWPQGDKVHTLNGTAVKNQTDYTSDPAVCGKDPLCYYSYHSVYYSLRGHDMWWGGGIVFINWPYPADSSCQGY